MDTINLYEAKTQLSRLVDRAAAGEEIVIAKAGRPMARLVSLEPARRVRKFGTLARQGHWVADHFDDPLPDDVQRAFDGDLS